MIKKTVSVLLAFLFFVNIAICPQTILADSGKSHLRPLSLAESKRPVNVALARAQTNPLAGTANDWAIDGLIQRYWRTRQISAELRNNVKTVFAQLSPAFASHPALLERLFAGHLDGDFVDDYEQELVQQRVDNNVQDANINKVMQDFIRKYLLVAVAIETGDRADLDPREIVKIRKYFNRVYSHFDNEPFGNQEISPQNIFIGSNSASRAGSNDMVILRVFRHYAHDRGDWRYFVVATYRGKQMVFYRSASHGLWRRLEVVVAGFFAKPMAENDLNLNETLNNKLNSIVFEDRIGVETIGTSDPVNTAQEKSAHKELVELRLAQEGVIGVEEAANRGIPLGRYGAWNRLGRDMDNKLDEDLADTWFAENLSNLNGGMHHPRVVASAASQAARPRARTPAALADFVTQPQAVVLRVSPDALTARLEALDRISRDVVNVEERARLEAGATRQRMLKLVARCMGDGDALERPGPMGPADIKRVNGQLAGFEELGFSAGELENRIREAAETRNEDPDEFLRGYRPAIEELVTLAQARSAAGARVAEAGAVVARQAAPAAQPKGPIVRISAQGLRDLLDGLKKQMANRATDPDAAARAATAYYGILKLIDATFNKFMSLRILTNPEILSEGQADLVMRNLDRFAERGLDYDGTWKMISESGRENYYKPLLDRLWDVAMRRADVVPEAVADAGKAARQPIPTGGQRFLEHQYDEERALIVAMAAVCDRGLNINGDINGAVGILRGASWEKYLRERGFNFAQCCQIYRNLRGENLEHFRDARKAIGIKLLWLRESSIVKIYFMGRDSVSMRLKGYPDFNHLTGPQQPLRAWVQPAPVRPQSSPQSFPLTQI